MYLVLNFKTYDACYGKSLDKMVQSINNHRPNGVEVIIAPPNSEVARIKSSFPKLKVYAQTVDLNEFGGFTGSMPLVSVPVSGLDGFIINHSENRKSMADIQKAIVVSKEKNIDYVVCVGTIDELKKVLEFKPKRVAIEPPELIGSGISISTAKPDIIVEAVKVTKRMSPSTELLVGAGVSTEADVRKSIQLGAQGVLLASAFVKAPDHTKKLEEFMSGFKP